MYAPIYRMALVRDGRQAVEQKRICSPEDAARILFPYFAACDREVLAVLGLSTRGHLIGIATVSIGCLDCTLTHPREVYKAALLMNAAGVIVAHNHPSGDPDPSQEDCAVTTRLASAGAILGIELFDHIVIGDASFVSIRQKGLANFCTVPGDCGCCAPTERLTPGGASYLSENRLQFMSAFDQTFTHEAEDGMLRAWNVTMGNQIAAQGHEMMAFPLSEHGITVEKLGEFYHGINHEHAMTTDLSRPLLFIPFFGEVLLIDGWHRLYKAAILGVEALPMYQLTQEESDTILWLTLPKGHGIKL